jgi:hypothetical protein
MLPGAWLSTSVDEQLSDAMGGVHGTAAWHKAVASIVISDGQLEITGGVTSLTVTWNEHIVLFPAGSVAV